MKADRATEKKNILHDEKFPIILAIEAKVRAVVRFEVRIKKKRKKETCRPISLPSSADAEKKKEKERKEMEKVGSMCKCTFPHTKSDRDSPQNGQLWSHEFGRR